MIANEDCFLTMSKMLDSSIDLVFTSPPYNRKRNDKYTHYDDDIEDYYSFLVKLIDESIRISKGIVFINIQKNYYNKEEVFRLIGEFSEELCEIFIWTKTNPMPAAALNITNAYEFVLCFGKSIKSNFTYTKNHISTSVAKMPKEHKAVMHSDIADFFILNFSKEGDLIYDPFMGIGTTALSCLRNGRVFSGSEISEEYCKMATKNIKQLS